MTAPIVIGDPHVADGPAVLAHLRASILRGDLSKPGLEAGEGMYISPCKSIHTFFMRYPIDVLLCHGLEFVTTLHRYNVKSMKRFAYARGFGVTSRHDM